MNKIMNTPAIEIVEDLSGHWVVETEAPVDGGVKFTFKVYEYSKNDYTTGEIETVGNPGYVKEVAQWFRSNRDALRYSFIEEVKNE